MDLTGLTIAAVPAPKHSNNYKCIFRDYIINRNNNEVEDVATNLTLCVHITNLLNII